MKTTFTTPVNSNQITQTSQLIPTSSTSVKNPSTRIREGYSPTEIILAAAILTLLSIREIACIDCGDYGFSYNFSACDGKPNKGKKEVVNLEPRRMECYSIAEARV